MRFALFRTLKRKYPAYLLLHSAINAGCGGSDCWFILPHRYAFGLFVGFPCFYPQLYPVCWSRSRCDTFRAWWDWWYLILTGYALLAPALYTAVVTIENQFASPFILGRRLELNHVALLLTLAFWGWIWGVSGIVLAVPLLVTLKVFSSHFDSLASVGVFLSEANDTKVPESSNQLD